MVLPGWTWKELVKNLVPPLLLKAYRAFRDLWQREITSQLPCRTVLELFPGIEKHAVSLPVSELSREGGFLPLQELLTLAAICKHVSPRIVCEIGTYKGGSTLILAMHAAEKATIYTLDLPSHDTETQCSSEIGDIARKPYIVGKRYRGTRFEANIRQLYGDSATFDFTPLYGSVDLVFIDGNHEYQNVMIDSEHAFQMLRPNGVIIWDDYHIDYGPGVIRALHGLTSRALVQVAGTRFVIYVDRA